MGSSSQESTANIEQFSKAICMEHDLCAMSQQNEFSSGANTYIARPHRRHLETESSTKISSSSLVSKSTSSTERIGVSSSFSSRSSALPCFQIAHTSLQKLSATATRGVLAKVSNLLKKTSHMSLGMLVFIVFAILSFNVCHTDARSTGLCRGVPCANGGRLLVSNSIWGDCRCRCPRGFVGPYCQYQVATKRSADTANVGNRRLSRSETMERIRQRLIVLSQRLNSRQENNQGELRGESTTNYDNNYLNVQDTIGAQERRINAFRSYRPRRSWHANDYKR